ncbi:hypothetical protein DCC79_02225 [bacterium]|nr:MAG: hypothetical protein DCC79_02225 [bacterium]
MILDPPTVARSPRGPFGSARAGLGVLFGHGLTLALVVIIGALGALLGVAAVVVPAVAAGAVIPAAAAAGPDVRWLAGALTVVLGILAIPFFVVWVAGGAGAVIAAVGAAVTGRPQGATAAYGAGLQRALPLVGGAVVTQVIRLLVWLPGYFALLAAGFFYALGARDADPRLQLLAVPFAVAFPIILAGLVHVHLRLSFTPFAVIHEDRGPIGAVERSWALTRGRTLQLAATAAVVVVAIALLFAGAIALIRTLGLTPDVANGMIADAGLRLAAALGRGPDVGYSAAVALAMGVNAAVLAGMLGIALWVVSVWSALYWDARAREDAGAVGPAADRTGAAAPADAPTALPMAAGAGMASGDAAIPAPPGVDVAAVSDMPPARPPDAEEIARMRDIDLAWSYTQPPETPEPPAEPPAEPPWSALPIASQSSDDAFAVEAEASPDADTWVPSDLGAPAAAPEPPEAAWADDAPGWAMLPTVDEAPTPAADIGDRAVASDTGGVAGEAAAEAAAGRDDDGDPVQAADVDRFTDEGGAAPDAERGGAAKEA